MFEKTLIIIMLLKGYIFAPYWVPAIYKIDLRNFVTGISSPFKVRRNNESMFLDTAKIKVKAGNGDGMAALRREKICP